MSFKRHFNLGTIYGIVSGKNASHSNQSFTYMNTLGSAGTNRINLEG